MVELVAVRVSHGFGADNQMQIGTAPSVVAGGSVKLQTQLEFVGGCRGGSRSCQIECNPRGSIGFGVDRKVIFGQWVNGAGRRVCEQR